MNLLRKNHFGQILRSISLNRLTIRLNGSKNLTQNGFPSLRSTKSDRLLARLFIVLLLLLVATACSQDNSDVFHDQFFAFGTLLDLTLFDVDPAAARQASEQN